MVQWTAEKDRILLKGIFEFCKISNSAALLKHLSEKIGEGCTPKAVSHRLNNLRAGGTASATPSSTPSRRSNAPQTPHKSATKSISKAKKKPVNEDNEFLSGQEEIVSPSVGRQKRNLKKRDYSESDNEDFEEILGKKIKIEADDEAEDGDFLDAESQLAVEDEV